MFIMFFEFRLVLKFNFFFTFKLFCIQAILILNYFKSIQIQIFKIYKTLNYVRIFSKRFSNSIYFVTFTWNMWNNWPLWFAKRAWHSPQWDFRIQTRTMEHPINCQNFPSDKTRINTQNFKAWDDEREKGPPPFMKINWLPP